MTSSKQFRLLTLLMTLIWGPGALAQSSLADSLPPSQIDIPVRINLKPIFALAEKNVDTVFTSPGYPNQWVQQGCDTRYKYRFRRSPLSMSMKGTTLDLSFTGFYQITGATRLCTGSTVLSPWSPACTCGVEEAERRVTVGYQARFSVYTNYYLRTAITRNEPVAHDKCEVCFWGQDVTSSVLDGLKEALDESKKEMQDSFGMVNLAPYMNQAWRLLKDVYTVPGIGYFSLNPKKLSMQNLNAANDFLNMNIGITATPVVSFIKPETPNTPLPLLSSKPNAGGFSIFLETALQYDSLSKIVNGYMAGKRFEVSEGLFKKHIIVKEVTLAGNNEEQLLLKVDFAGSFEGTAYFVGKPVYNAATQTIEIENLDYDLQTRNLLLKTAKWLFSGKVEKELKKYASINLSGYFQSAQQSLNAYLNKEWTKGIRGSGTIQKLELQTATAKEQHLLLRTNCTGHLAVVVSELSLGLH